MRTVVVTVTGLAAALQGAIDSVIEVLEDNPLTKDTINDAVNQLKRLKEEIGKPGFFNVRSG